MKKITIIGTGYVGLVTGAGIAEFGHNVTCADIDQNKIDQINRGEIPIYEPGLKSLVSENIKKGHLTFSSEVELCVESADIIFITVKPSSKNEFTKAKNIAPP